MNDAPHDEIQDILTAAEGFAREAGEITLRYFGGMVDADDKSDGTPVTIADRQAEEHIRARIEEVFPDHGILGEEYGETKPGARCRWILDPIDGTRSFMHGVPLYGVLIGVEIEGEARVGVANFPALGELIAAGEGLGCRLNGEPTSVSPTTELRKSLVLTTDVERILATPSAAGFRKLQQGADFARTWGDCYGHCLVATGRVEIMIDPILSPWDAGPLLTIVTEAGGRWTSFTGEASIHAGSGVATNGHLHDLVLETLAGG